MGLEKVKRMKLAAPSRQVGCRIRLFATHVSREYLSSEMIVLKMTTFVTMGGKT